VTTQASPCRGWSSMLLQSQQYQLQGRQQLLRPAPPALQPNAWSRTCSAANASGGSVCFARCGPPVKKWRCGWGQQGWQKAGGIGWVPVGSVASGWRATACSWGAWPSMPWCNPTGVGLHQGPLQSQAPQRRRLLTPAPLPTCAACSTAYCASLSPPGACSWCTSRASSDASSAMSCNERFNFEKEGS